MQEYLNKWNKRLEKLQTTKELKEAELYKVKEKRKRAGEDLIHIRKFQGILNTAIEMTQKSLEMKVSNIVSSLLSSISEDPYEFLVKFKPRRNTMECDLFFKRGEKKLHILESCGHGCADLASMGLKISHQKMQKGKRQVLLMDEPFRQLQKDLHGIVAEVLGEIAKTAGIQFIIVTHEKALIENADKAFHVVQRKGVSYVE